MNTRLFTVKSATLSRSILGLVVNYRHQAAIAAAISLRCYLLVTPTQSPDRSITLDFSDVGLTHTWPIVDLPWAEFAQSSKVKRASDRVDALDSELLDALHPHVSTISLEAAEHTRKIHQQAATAFLYLLLSLSTPDSQSCTYTMRSTIPIASGLGSSAAISVCISAALLLQAKQLERPGSKLSQEEEINKINQWAFVGELCIHGNPSGVDNTVATRGKAVLFRRTETGKPPMVKPLNNFPVLPLLLVDTKQARSTAVEVAKVGALRKEQPEVTDMLLDSIDRVTQAALDLIIHDDFNPGSLDSLQQLGNLTRINHGLLVALGVSHPKLERVRELIDHAGVGWTKLTGAGGGGCTITILKAGVATEMLHKVEHDVDAEGFARYETLLGGEGVGLLQFGGDNPITQDSFLAAKSSIAIEDLVGFGQGEGKRPWRFWTA